MSDPAQRKLTAQAALNNTTVEQIITSAAIQFSGHSTQTNIKPISESQAKTGSDSGDMKNTEPLNNFQTMLRGTYASDKDLMKFNDPEQAAKFEGLVLGIIGSIIPIILTTYGYTTLYNNFDGKVLSSFISLVEPTMFIYKLSGLLVAIGIAVGMFGSWRAVRKHLKI